MIPLYNEEDNVAPLIEEIRHHLRSYEYELILVDDGSTDATVSRVPVGENVRLICFERNAGQSAAMVAGMKAARGDVIVFMDGDRQNDPADIPRMLVGIGAGADMVCGNRRNRRDTVGRRMSSRVANAIRGFVLSDGVVDTGCTLKAMRKECRDAVVPFHGMHRFIPALVKEAGYRVSEISVNHRSRMSGESKYGLLNRTWWAALDLVGVWWICKRRLAYKAREVEAKQEVDSPHQ